MFKSHNELKTKTNQPTNKQTKKKKRTRKQEHSLAKQLIRPLAEDQ